MPLKKGGKKTQLLLPLSGQRRPFSVASAVVKLVKKLTFCDFSIFYNTTNERRHGKRQIKKSQTTFFQARLLFTLQYCLDRSITIWSKSSLCHHSVQWCCVFWVRVASKGRSLRGFYGKVITMYGRKTPSTYRSTPSVYSHYTGKYVTVWLKIILNILFQ